MAKRENLRIPLDFENTVKALLQTPPPPASTPGSRKASTKTRKRKKAKPAKRRSVGRVAVLFGSSGLCGGLPGNTI
jgi:hypothetical protein